MNICEKILREIEKEQDSNKSSYTIKGVKGLTYEDLENIKKYVTFYKDSNGYGLNGFIPYGDGVKEVLKKCGLMW